MWFMHDQSYTDAASPGASWPVSRSKQPSSIKSSSKLVSAGQAGGALAGHSSVMFGLQGSTWQSHGTEVAGSGYSEHKELETSAPSKMRRHFTSQTCTGPVEQSMQSLNDVATQAAATEGCVTSFRWRRATRLWVKVLKARSFSSKTPTRPTPRSSFTVSTLCLCCSNTRPATGPTSSQFPSLQSPLPTTKAMFRANTIVAKHFTTRPNIVGQRQVLAIEYEQLDSNQ